MQLTRKEAEKDYRLWTGAGHRFFCLRLEGEWIGFAHLGSRGGAIDWLEDLYVEAAYQGQGIGRVVISYLEGLVREYSESLYIEVAARNQRALHLYRELGYTCLNTLTLRKDFKPEHFEVVEVEQIAGRPFEIKQRKKDAPVSEAEKLDM